MAILATSAIAILSVLPFFSRMTMVAPSMTTRRTVDIGRSMWVPSFSSIISRVPGSCDAISWDFDFSVGGVDSAGLSVDGLASEDFSTFSGSLFPGSDFTDSALGSVVTVAISGFFAGWVFLAGGWRREVDGRVERRGG